MFNILRKSLRTGVVTTRFPESAPEISARARGKPEIDFEHWKDARAAAGVCPTRAIDCVDRGRTRTVTLDLGRCVFCGLCADEDPAIRMTNQCVLSASDPESLKSTADYSLEENGSHQACLAISPSVEPRAPGVAFEQLGNELRAKAGRIFGRSLHIRQVDAGSCNGCEMEITGLNSPVYDIERFGVHFVASPRHADMLLVTGPVTRNMEMALRKTYEAMPEPRLVVAVGACGCSGGIFGQNYATVGGVDRVVPVDVYIPGCPPNPHALLHGILMAIGRTT